MMIEAVHEYEIDAPESPLNGEPVLVRGATSRGEADRRADSIVKRVFAGIPKHAAAKFVQRHEVPMSVRARGAA